MHYFSLNTSNIHSYISLNINTYQSQQNFILNLDHFSTAAMLETSPQPCTAHSAMTPNSCQQTFTNDRTSTKTNKSTPNKVNQISKPLKISAQTSAETSPFSQSIFSAPQNLFIASSQSKSRTDKSQLLSQVSNKCYILRNSLNTVENNKFATPNTFEINATIAKRVSRELDFTFDGC